MQKIRMMHGKYTRKLVFAVVISILVCNPLKTDEIVLPVKAIPPGIRDLRILTWNIYMLPYCSRIKGNCKRAKAIADKMVSSEYDIIVFEEAFDHRARNILRKQLEKSYPHIYGPVNNSFSSFRTNSGIWILSKIPFQILEEIEFKSRCGIDAMARKGAVILQGQWQGQEFQLLCTHLQADSPDVVRREQCGEIADRLLKKYTKDDVPLITCGDFNIEADDEENYRYMLSVLDSEDGLMEGKIQNSYDEIDNELARRNLGKKRLIDYILVRHVKNGLNISRRVVVFKGNNHNGAYNLSDHYGIEASIHFNTLHDPALSYGTSY